MKRWIIPVSAVLIGLSLMAVCLVISLALPTLSSSGTPQTLPIIALPLTITILDQHDAGAYLEYTLNTPYDSDITDDIRAAYQAVKNIPRPVKVYLCSRPPPATTMQLGFDLIFCAPPIWFNVSSFD